MKRPELLIFDMDGLVFDTERLFMNARAKVLEKYGYRHRDEDYIKTLGTSGEHLRRILLEIYGPDYPEAAVSKESRDAQMNDIRSFGPPVKRGIPDLLSAAKSAQLPCCIATSSPASVAAELLSLAELEPYFSFVIGGDMITHSKPDPEIFLMACRRAGVSPADALVLEDSENGILAAARGGIPVICIPDLKQPAPEIRKCAAAVCGSACDVIPLISASSD